MSSATVDFNGSNKDPRYQNFLVFLDGRTSITYRIDNFAALSFMNLNCDTNIYGVMHGSNAVYLHK